MRTNSRSTSYHNEDFGHLIIYALLLLSSDFVNAHTVASLAPVVNLEVLSRQTRRSVLTSTSGKQLRDDSGITFHPFTCQHIRNASQDVLYLKFLQTFVS